MVNSKPKIDTENLRKGVISECIDDILKEIKERQLRMEELGEVTDESLGRVQGLIEAVGVLMDKRGDYV